MLIKGMEMPKDGCHHMICIYADGTVSTGGRVYTAIPVPPHGRLIDAGKLYDVLEALLTSFLAHTATGVSQSFEAGYFNGVKDAASALSNAPTIIPAEEDY